MKTPILAGDLLIINEADRPCTRLIAIAERRDDEGRIWARYVSLEHKSWPIVTTTQTLAQHLADFGVEIRVGDSAFVALPKSDSRAEYASGKPRAWQDHQDSGVPIDYNPALRELLFYNEEKLKGSSS